MQKMTLHCTRASVRSAYATHGVSQVSGALRRIVASLQCSRDVCNAPKAYCTYCCSGGVPAAPLQCRRFPAPRSESGEALQRHDSWRSVRAPSRCVRSSDVGRARRILRHAHRAHDALFVTAQLRQRHGASQRAAARRRRARGSDARALAVTADAYGCL